MVFALAGLSPNQARGYKLNYTWSSAAWAPGETIEVAVVDSPELRARGIAQIRRILQRALDAWTTIPSADIRWELGPTVSEAEARDRFPMSIRVSPGRPYVVKTFGGTAGFVRCTAYVSDQSEFLASSAVHELGHCLGLGHAEELVLRDDVTRSDDYPIYWRYDPRMSYGTYEDPFHLTADDAIGASLLRPREGWLETVGSIVGRVTLPDGEAVPYAYVQATLLEPASQAYSVGVHTPDIGLVGGFEIRGLIPGSYQLLVRSSTGWPFSPRIPLRLEAEGPLVLRQTLRVGAVVVRAGEETGLVPLAVRRREEPFR